MKHGKTIKLKIDKKDWEDSDNLLKDKTIHVIDIKGIPIKYFIDDTAYIVLCTWLREQALGIHSEEERRRNSEMVQKAEYVQRCLQHGKITLTEASKMLQSDKSIEEDLKELKKQ